VLVHGLDHLEILGEVRLGLGHQPVLKLAECLVGFPHGAKTAGKPARYTLNPEPYFPDFSTIDFRFITAPCGIVSALTVKV